MKDDLKTKRLFYGRFIVSIGLYCVFIISSVMELLTRSSAPPSLLIGGLLIGAVVILPRSVRRIRRAPSDAAPREAQAADAVERMQKSLTAVRFVYLVGAIFVWLALPALI